jgi:lipopolysaccharide export system permease protein
MKDITIFDFSAGEVPTTIMAPEGRLAYSEDGTTLKLDLKNGEIHEVPRDGDVRKYHRLQFTSHSLLLHNADMAFEIPRREARGEREMNIARLQTEILRLKESYAERDARLDSDLDSLGFSDYATFVRRVLPAPEGLSGWMGRMARVFSGPEGDRVDLPQQDRERIVLSRMELDNLQKRINAYSVEVHKKLSIPFACIVFVLVGAPMGLLARRGGLATSAISVVFFVIYYLFLLGGEQLADRNLVSPAAAMWAPNVILGVPGLLLTWRSMTGAGGATA